jgi:hypothetical protein
MLAAFGLGLAVSSPRTEVLPQPGLAADPIAGPTVALALIERLPVSRQERKDDLVTASPNPRGRIHPGITMHSHDIILTGAAAKSGTSVICS